MRSLSAALDFHSLTLAVGIEEDVERRRADEGPLEAVSKSPLRRRLDLALPQSHRSRTRYLNLK